MNAMTDPENVVVVGNGQAGIQLVDSLRREGYTGPITLLGEEPHHPYQRPPLSKDYLAAGKDPVPLPLRPEKFFTTNDVDARLGVHVTSIDRAARTVTLDDGTTLAYSKLVLATGAANRELTVPGADLAGIHGLRTLTDAQALHARLDAVRSVVVIGAGFIGLEFAAAARARGLDVTVLEYADRPMGRALTPVMSGFFADAHQRLGVTLRLGEGIASFDGDENGHVTAAVSTTGQPLPGGPGAGRRRRHPAHRTRGGRRPGSGERHRGGRQPAHLRPGHLRPRRLRILPERPRRDPDAAGIRAERHRPGPARRPRHRRFQCPARSRARYPIRRRIRRLRRPALVLVQPRTAAPPDRRPGSPRRPDRAPRKPGRREVLRVLLPQRRRWPRSNPSTSPPTTWPPAASSPPAAPSPPNKPPIPTSTSRPTPNNNPLRSNAHSATLPLSARTAWPSTASARGLRTMVSGQMAHIVVRDTGGDSGRTATFLPSTVTAGASGRDISSA